jgi:hypothetical protein
MKRSIVLVFILVLTASSLIMVKPTFAQTTPSVPEFTLNLAAHPYVVQPIYSIDPYTGNSVRTYVGRNDENKSIEVWIKNQPFTSYNDSKGNPIKLYYNIREKGHFADWTSELNPENYLSPTDSEFTGLTYFYGENRDPYGYSGYSFWLGDLSNGSQVDFQVEAIIGHYALTSNPEHPLIPATNVFAIDGMSDWSSTQTITIPVPSASSPTPSPAPSITPSPSIPEFPPWIIPPLAMITVLVAVLASKRKRKIPTNC